MADQRRGGKIQFNVNGVLYDAKGNFSYGLGTEKREGIVGADRVHGYKATPQIPYIEGEITDRNDLDLASLASTTDATVTLSLANGKTIVLREAWYAAEGKGQSEEGNIEIRFEGMSADEVR